jgi:hypothetical protein
MEASEVRDALALAWPELAGPLDESDKDAIADGLTYLQMAAIARYLGARMGARETECMQPTFDAVERCLQEGSPEAVELVMVGLVEHLQNANVTRVCDDSRWVPYLRPVSLGAWKAVSDFWKGDPDAIKRFSRSLKSDPPARP